MPLEGIWLPRRAWFIEQVSGSALPVRVVCHLHSWAELERHGGHPKASANSPLVSACKWHAPGHAGSPEAGDWPFPGADGCSGSAHECWDVTQVLGRKHVVGAASLFTPQLGPNPSAERK